MKKTVLLGLLFSLAVQAKEFKAQGRIFGGSLPVDADDVNTELAAQGLEDLDSILKFGVEILYPASKYLEVGLRYTKRLGLSEELSNPEATEFDAQFAQDAMLALVRVPFIKTGHFRLDAFAGYGGTNTTLKITTASQDGEITKKDSGAWFANPYSSYGVSAGIGFNGVFVFVEGGVEENKIKKLKRSGNINTNINEIDLSGTYVAIGLLFDGVKATSR